MSGTVCGNCGQATGPFDRIWIGTRKNGRWVITCPAKETRRCNERRAMQDFERWGSGVNVRITRGS